jgi:hypothetical protein
MLCAFGRDNVALVSGDEAPKEANEMREICFCGRVGEVEDREPVVLEDGETALRCPGCGHVDHVAWLPDEARAEVFEQARERRELREPPTAA